jgi:hypothetical protein
MVHWQVARKIKHMKRELDRKILFAQSVAQKPDICDYERGFHLGQIEAFKAEKGHLEEIITG